jgi:hypothetical protein
MSSAVHSVAAMGGLLRGRPGRVSSRSTSDEEDVGVYTSSVGQRRRRRRTGAGAVAVAASDGSAGVTKERQSLRFKVY